MSTLAEIEAAVATLESVGLEPLEKLLRNLRARQLDESRLREIARRNGFDPLPKRSDEVVTVEMVRQLCEEEGI